MTMTMKMRARRLCILAAALLAGCAWAAPAPAQWSDWLDRLSETVITPEQERQIAESEHPKILAQFGGAYDNPAITAYVGELVNRLGKSSERPEIAYRVTVLNTPVVNAFALPAGYVYTTRGLLALCNSEAELAGVMAHEMGHVTARHTAQRYGRAMLATGVSGLAGLLNSPMLQQIAQLGGQAWIQSFSRDQEYQADQLGVATMARGGYEPMAMASFLTTLAQQTDLQASLAGRKPGESDHFNLFATHPRTADRVERAVAQAGLADRGKGREERDAYLRRIDGIVYGDDPAQGFVRGRVFAHPAMRFRFEVPEGFQLLNGAAEVTAPGPGGAIIRFDAAAETFRGPMRAYVTDVWGRQAPLSNVETLNVTGMEAASAITRMTTQGGAVDVRLTAIRFAADAIFRFQFISPVQATAQLWPQFGLVTGSFRRLSEPEAAAMRPQHLRIIAAARGDTADTLAQRMAPDDHKLERFRALNGLAASQPVVPGRLYKLAVE